jgi:hypothetical protein
MGLSAEYGDGHNVTGAGAGIAFMLIFTSLYALFFDSTAYVLSAEVLPQHLRSYGMGNRLCVPRYILPLARLDHTNCLCEVFENLY